ncbi:MAG: Ig-like domain-containing protein [Nitrososphaera sp.]|uniref:Ig-like domain-containing protein n=1 Tax=Nitrososphaera sp. TaxID=1971748 RepID=UPI003D6DA909
MYNSQPVAQIQSVSTTEEVPAPVRLAATDADGDWLEFQIVSDPRYGTLSGVAPDLTYTPDAEFYGQDSFAFMASDSFGGSATATVAVTVAASAPVPVPEPAPQPEPAQLYCGRKVSSFAHVIDGTEGYDSLTSTKEDDLIMGYGGSDALKGKAGNDCIMGGLGDDRMYGDGGDDALNGEAGDDTIYDDTIDGGDGDDRCWDIIGSNKATNREGH